MNTTNGSDQITGTITPGFGSTTVSIPSPTPLSFGQKLVGINFNPSADDKVGQAKRLCAELADLVAGKFLTQNREGESASELEVQLYNHTVGEILNAQMNVVKLLTLKY